MTTFFFVVILVLILMSLFGLSRLFLLSSITPLADDIPTLELLKSLLVGARFDPLITFYSVLPLFLVNAVCGLLNREDRLDPAQHLLSISPRSPLACHGAIEPGFLIDGKRLARTPLIRNRSATILTRNL